MSKVLFKVNIALFLAVVFGFIVALIWPVQVKAECEPNYGGGENCTFNKSFEIEKQVRIKDSDDDFKDKLSLKNIEVGKAFEVEYRIKIKNVGDISVDDMKYTDYLPAHFERIGGSGLTEYWEDFEPGEVKEFKLFAALDAEVITETLVDCFVNDVYLSWDGNFEGSDVATVCIVNGEITELPETGPTANIVMTILGLSSLTSGLGLRKLWA